MVRALRVWSSVVLVGSLVVFFGPRPSYAVVTLGTETRLSEPNAKAPRGIAAADVIDNVSPTCPGCLDLIIANQTGDSVSLLTGNGAGGFTQFGNNVSVGNGPMSVATGDCDGDGDQDIFVANNGASTVTVLVNQRAQGNPNTFTTSTVGLTRAPVFVLAKTAAGGILDINGDGKLDLAVAEKTGDKVQTLIGNGACGFTNGQDTIFGGNGVETLAAADIDGVNGVDLVTSARLTGGGTAILFNNGTGTFATSCPTAQCLLLGAGSEPSSVVTANFDGTNGNDIGVTDADNGDSTSTTGLVRFLNAGAGSFGAPNTFGTGGKGPESAVVGDFDGDTLLDVVALNKDAKTLGFAHGLGNGFFSTAVISNINGTGPEEMAAGDFNGDGRPDIAIVNKASNNFSVCLNSSVTPGTFTCTASTAQPSGFGSSPRGIAVADMGTTGSATPDGLNDIVIVNEGSDDVSVLINDGTGHFTSLFRPPFLLSAQATNPRDVAAFDSGNGGTTDLAIAACGATAVTKDKLVVVLDRNFAGASYYAANDCPSAVAVVDLDGDGKLDLAVVNQNSDDVSIFKNVGSGAFVWQRNVCSSPNMSGCDDVQPTAISFGDFGTAPGNATPDGKVDLVVSNKNTNNFSILFGNGAFDFPTSSRTNAIANGQPQGIAAYDFNGDGFADVAIANHNTGNSGVTTSRGVQVFLGQGGGAFLAAQNFDVGKQPTAIKAVNVSGDTGGRIDLVASSEGSDQVAVLEGRGNATGSAFEGAVVRAVGLNPRAVATGALDAGTTADLVTANNGSDDASLVPNTSPVCGDSVVSGGEGCDPPASTCSTGCASGVCSATCRCQ